MTRPRPTEIWAPRAAEQGELHGASSLPFNQDSAECTCTLLNPTTATDRSDSPDTFGEPQLSQVALDDLAPVVDVYEPRDGVQQCALLRVRQGTVAGVGQQQIQVVRCRVRQLPLVSVKLAGPNRSAEASSRSFSGMS